LASEPDILDDAAAGASPADIAGCVIENVGFGSQGAPLLPHTLGLKPKPSAFSGHKRHDRRPDLLRLEGLFDVRVFCEASRPGDRIVAPRITQALFWNELVTAAIQREWTLKLGQRTAYERIAHLFVEIFLRLQTVGRTQGKACEFPLTQNDIADATGLTAVHVNRTLQDLRRDGLVELQSRVLTVPDLKALRNAAMFNDNYLHLDGEGRHLDAND